MKMRTEMRVDYYEVTGDSDKPAVILRNRIVAIKDNIDEPHRETTIKGVSYNMNATESSSKGVVMGSISAMRQVAPGKRKLGQNNTTVIQLEDDEGISETTFFVVDYINNLVGVSYNHHGPRASTLLLLINELYEKKIAQPNRDNSRLSIVPIIIGSKIESVLKSTKITAITARLRAPISKGSISQNANWDVVFNTLNLPETATKEITVKDRHGGLVDTVRNMLSNKRRTFVDDYDKLKISFLSEDTGKIDTTDLIKNRLSETLTVDFKNGSNQIDGTNALNTMLKNIKFVEREYKW